jgi:glycolate dehydrogenase iron-sulfur subunit
MQTSFSVEQLADPDIRETEKILRACVHCGFCTATCPTYTLLGDELDSPRGRIYLIKDMLENDRPASPVVVKHLDRCLSCLSCMTTCPSGVHYQHLVDHGRRYIEETYTRPASERALRWFLGRVLSSPSLFRWAFTGSRLARPLASLLPGQLRSAVDVMPDRLPPKSPFDGRRVFPAEGETRARAALLTGCVQRVLNPAINDATVRILTRHGVEVVVAEGAGCCGALLHHLGEPEPSNRQALQNVEAWWKQTTKGGGAGLDAIIVNTSGCGTQIKDYGFMFRNDADWADKAAAVSLLTRDVTEFLAEIGLSEPVRATGHAITYHSACSMQHGQKITAQPIELLSSAGFRVKTAKESHLCCGSAGVYNLLQPQLARQLRDRKIANIERTHPQIIAAGNIGCMTQLAKVTDIPIVHTVELLDWATGGPQPPALAALEAL